MSGFTLTPVDGDPFASAQQPAQQPAAPSNYKLTPVDHDPFANASPLGGTIPTASGSGSTLMDVARSMSVLPFSDRIVAAEHSLPLIGNGQSYSDNLAQEDAARQQLQTTRPVLSMVGRTVGTLPLLAVPGMAGAGAGLAPSIGAGVATGGAYGAAQGVSDQPDLSNVPADLSGASHGAVEGGTLGGLFSGLGYGLGKMGNALMDWVTGSPLPLSAQGRSLSAMADASTSDANARRLLFNADMPRAPTDFGPQGMTLDSGPAMQALAQKTAATPQGALIKAAVIDRANNVDQDISQALPSIIGPDQSALAATVALKADRSSAGQALQPIFAKAPPVDVSPVFNQIDTMMATLPVGTPEQLALDRAHRMLVATPAQPGIPATRTPVLGPQGQVIRYDTTPAVPYAPTQLVTDAQTLNAAKQSLDNLINFGDPTIGVTPGALASREGSLRTVRGGINDALRSQVPGYGDTMDALSGLARQVEGIQYRQNLLNTGKTAIHPNDAALKFGGMTPEELDATRAGVNSEIYRLAGAPANKTGLDMLNATLPNDAQTGDRWNAENLGQVYPQDAMQQLLALKDQGNQFRSAAAQIGAQPLAPTRAPVTPTDAGWIAYDAARGLHGVPLLTANTLNAIGRLAPGTAAKNSALAKALTSTGAEKDSIGAAIGNLLARRVAGQNAGMTLAPVFSGAGLGAFDR
jgi:hypothetical protein